MLGLSNGDAKILGNAGARVAADALGTLVLATHWLGVDRVMLVAHTDYRMTKVTDDQVHATRSAAAPISRGVLWSSGAGTTSGRPHRRACPC